MNLFLVAALVSGSALCAAQQPRWHYGEGDQQQGEVQERNVLWAGQDRDDDDDHGKHKKDREGDGRYGQGQYGQGQYGQGQYGNDPASARGGRDGFRDGQSDAQRGRRVDPSQNDRYRNTPGYSSEYGDGNQYQANYRQAYLNGYRQGLGQGWYGGNNGNNNGRYGRRGDGNNQGQYGQGGDGRRRGDGEENDEGQQGQYGNGQYGNGSNGNGSYGNDQYGNGQYGDGRYGQGQVDPGQANSNRIAYQNGFRAGQLNGQGDVRSNRRHDYKESQAYGNASGWNARMGDRNQYKQYFRQGFTEGYEQAWANARANGR